MKSLKKKHCHNKNPSFGGVLWLIEKTKTNHYENQYQSK